MYYHYQSGVVAERGSARRWLIMAGFIVMIVAVLYLILLYIAPRLISVPFTAQASAGATAQKIANSKPSSDRLYIPQFNVDIPVEVGNTAQLGQGAAVQTDKSQTAAGDQPLNLCAQRFGFSFNPAKVRQNSPFYNVSRLSAGDQIVLDYSGTRYEYQVLKAGQASPDASRPDDTNLILFTCDSDGQADGSATIYAKNKNPVDKPKKNQTSQESDIDSFLQ